MSHFLAASRWHLLIKQLTIWFTYSSLRFTWVRRIAWIWIWLQIAIWFTAHNVYLNSALSRFVWTNHMTISIRSLLRVILTCGDKRAACASFNPADNLNDNVTVWLLKFTSNLIKNSIEGEIISIKLFSICSRNASKRIFHLLGVNTNFRLSSGCILYDQK